MVLVVSPTSARYQASPLILQASSIIEPMPRSKSGKEDFDRGIGSLLQLESQPGPLDKESEHSKQKRQHASIEEVNGPNRLFDDARCLLQGLCDGISPLHSSVVIPFI